MAMLIMVTLGGSGSRCGQNAERQLSHLPPGPAMVTRARKGISATPKGVLTESPVQRSKVKLPACLVLIMQPPAPHHRAGKVSMLSRYPLPSTQPEISDPARVKSPNYGLKEI